MNRRSFLAVASGAAIVGAASAQTPRAATIADAAWLAGRWTGEGLDGLAEEAWSPPADGAMIGHFQLLRAGAVAFYELMQIVETGEGLAFKVRHVNRDFTAWEDKADAVVFPFLSAAPGLLRFRGLTLERTGADAMTVTVTIRYPDGVRDEPFRFVRQP